VLYSDGVTELADGTGEGFGSERLERALRRSRQTVGRAGRGSARAVRESLFDALFHFKGDAAQRDDVTMVVVRRPAPKL
jgi:serine phosphatase RsbU (regulator of sigma subunit)